MFLESVISFYKRLIKDQDFRSQLETTASPEECRKMIQEAGYEFTQEELEIATVQILEENRIKDLDNSFSELSEQELELAFGGVTFQILTQTTPSEDEIKEKIKEILSMIEIDIPGNAAYGVVSPEYPEYVISPIEIQAFEQALDFKEAQPSSIIPLRGSGV